MKRLVRVILDIQTDEPLKILRDKLNWDVGLYQVMDDPNRAIINVQVVVLKEIK